MPRICKGVLGGLLLTAYVGYLEEDLATAFGTLNKAAINVITLKRRSQKPVTKLKNFSYDDS